MAKSKEKERKGNKWGWEQEGSSGGREEQRERVWRETTGITGHLGGDMDTVQWKLPGTYEGDLIMEDMELEQAIFCNSARLLVVGLEHQPSHKAFEL